MDDRRERRTISRMKGDGLEFFAVNHLPPVIRSLYYFPRALARAFIVAAVAVRTYTHVQRAATRTAKRQGDSHFFPNDTEPPRTPIGLSTSNADATNCQ